MTPLEKLRDAIQEYHRTIGEPEGVIVTDFALAYAGVDMRSADDDSYVGTIASGPVHASLGLADILTDDLMSHAQGDDQ